MNNIVFKGGPPIKTWEKFAKHVRSNGCDLIKELPRFPLSVLVTGCQRSGTTILSRVITQSDGMVNYWFGRDDELDAALILSGYIEHQKLDGRYCFQTTFLNECYSEYFNPDSNFKMIVVLRNPHSVVYSLLHNWKRFAFNELFHACGTESLSENEKIKYQRFGKLAFSRVFRACMSYNGKLLQLLEVKKKLGESTVMMVEYDDIVIHKDRTLQAIYQFIDLPYKHEYGEKIHTSSLKKADRLSKREISYIEKYSMPLYEKLKLELSKY